MEEDYYHILKEKIKLHLMEYLEDNQPEEYQRTGTDINFKCIAHSPDVNPSMFVGHKMPHIATCRTCMTTVNIFNFHALYEDAPEYGRDFLEKNLNVLALKYGYEPLVIADLTEDQLYKMKMYDIHEAACDILRAGEVPKGCVSRKFTQELGISKDIADTMGIGTVTDFDAFVTEIQKAGGWAEDEVTNAGIHSLKFGGTMLSYAVHNNRGRCIAFASRDWRYDGRFGVTKEQTYTDRKGVEKRRAKWQNSNTSVIYEKVNSLYGFHRAVKHNNNTKVYVVEGHADAAIMWTHGINNVVCVGGTSFSATHVNMLKNIDKSIVIICLDNDEAGWKATDRVLEEGFKNAPFVKGQVLLVPSTPREDGRVDVDPDTFIKAHGKEAFLDLRPLSAFEYTIKRIPDKFESDDEKDMFVKRFIPIIMNETSAITQQMMRKAVASKIGVQETLIREYQSNLEYVQNNERRERLKKANSRFFRNMDDALNFDPEKVLNLTTSFRDLVNETMNSQYTVKLGLQEVMDGFANWKVERETTKAADLFWKTGWDFWDSHMGGIQKQDTFIGISGPSNMGKSSIMTNSCIGLLKNNPLDKLLVMYWTIDDTKETLYTKLVAMLAQVNIYQVYTAAEQEDSVQARINKAIYVLEGWIKSSNLLVKGGGIGKAGSDVQKWVEVTQAKFPDKQIVLLIDSFSNMTGIGEELQVQEQNINILHDMRCDNNMAIMSTFEMNKEGSEGRSTGKGMRGTAKLFYRLTRNLTIFNDHKSCEQKQNPNPEFYWLNSKGDKRPVLEACLGKTKNMSPGGGGKAGDNTLYFQYEPDIGCLHEIGPESKFSVFQTENNSQRQHTELGLKDWKVKSNPNVQPVQNANVVEPIVPPLNSSLPVQNTKPEILVEVSQMKDNWMDDEDGL